MRNRIMGLIVPANRNLVSLGSSLGLERMLFSVSMLFSYWCLVSSIYFRFPSFVHVRLFVVFPRFSGARNMELFLVLVGLHKKKDGIRQLVGTVPLRAGTAVNALFCCCVIPVSYTDLTLQTICSL